MEARLCSWLPPFFRNVKFFPVSEINFRTPKRKLKLYWCATAVLRKKARSVAKSNERELSSYYTHLKKQRTSLSCYPWLMALMMIMFLCIPREPFHSRLLHCLMKGTRRHHFLRLLGFVKTFMLPYLFFLNRHNWLRRKLGSNRSLNFGSSNVQVVSLHQNWEMCCKPISHTNLCHWWSQSAIQSLFSYTAEHVWRSMKKKFERTIVKWCKKSTRYLKSRNVVWYWIHWISILFIRASPDGLVCCFCCGDGTLEIKCPFSCRNRSFRQVAEKKIILFDWRKLRAKERSCYSSNVDEDEGLPSKVLRLCCVGQGWSSNATLEHEPSSTGQKIAPTSEDNMQCNLIYFCHLWSVTI